MKRRKLMMWCAAIALGATACCGWEETNFGYPEEVIFSKEGGNQVITGDRTDFIIEASDQDSDAHVSGSITCDTCTVNKFTIKWLSVEQNKSQKAIKLTVAPNTGKSTRKILLTLMPGGPLVQDIIVVQRP